MLESLVGGFAVILIVAVLPFLGLVGVAVPYAVLRMRDAKSETPDPQLGLKVGYHFFFSLGVLLVHLGLTVNVADYLIEENAPGAPAQFGPNFGGMQPVRANKGADGKLLTPTMRIGWALTASGFLFAVVFGIASLLGTNVRRFPAVRRTFVGWRMIVCGLAVLAAVTTLLIWMFQKDNPDNKTYETAIATLAIWAPSLAVHLFLMQRYSKEYHVPGRTKPAPPRPVDDEEDDDEN
jgi:hypothetical protein